MLKAAVIRTECVFYLFFFNHAVKFYLIELQCVVPVFVSMCTNKF